MSEADSNPSVSDEGAGTLLRRLTLFSSRLRDRGVGVTQSDQIDAARALRLIDLGDPDEVRRTLRTALKVERRHWPAFEELFRSHWIERESGDVDPLASQGEDDGAERQPTLERDVTDPDPASERSRRLDPSTDPDEADSETRVGAADADRPGYSPRPQLRRVAFDELDDRDLAAMEKLLSRLAVRLAVRRSRRLVASPKGGFVDLRRSLRGAVGAGGDLLELARRERAVELPRLVLLCDTSGSMDPYTRFLLTFVLSLRRVARRTEVFAFNTELTRLTGRFAAPDVRATLQALAQRVPDWSGGTRIGACLEEFRARHLRELVDARTTVVILSDGLDRGDPELLADALSAIRRRARKVVWLNPLAGDPRYRPEARGMKAALPHVDRFLPAHDLESLERLVPVLGA